MSEFPTRKHSDEVIAAMVTASNTGLNGSQISKQLNAGTLAAWPHGPYEIPYGTVGYFIRKARKEALAGAHKLSDRATGDMHAALDGFGREIATELFEKLRIERAKKSPNVENLAKLATVAAKIKPLIKDTPAKQPVTVEREDPFAKKLRVAEQKRVYLERKAERQAREAETTEQPVTATPRAERTPYQADKDTGTTQAEGPPDVATASFGTFDPWDTRTTQPHTEPGP